jgi:hypothetical protein
MAVVSDLAVVSLFRQKPVTGGGSVQWCRMLDICNTYLSCSFDKQPVGELDC